MLDEVKFAPRTRSDVVKISQVIGRGLKGAIVEGAQQVFVEIVSIAGGGKSLISDVILNELNDSENPYKVPQANKFSLEKEVNEAAWGMLETQFLSNGILIKFGYTTMPFSSFEFRGIANAPKPYDSWNHDISVIDVFNNVKISDKIPEILVFGHKSKRSREVNPFEKPQGEYDFIDLTINIGNDWSVSVDTPNFSSNDSIQHAFSYIKQVCELRQMRYSKLSC